MSKNAKSADFNRFNINIPYFGPSHVLDTLSYVYTDVLVQDDIIDDIDASLHVRLPHQLLSIRDIEVHVMQEVARFTQINKVIPIKLKNVPKGKELRIKPSQVDLSYWVAMKDVREASIDSEVAERDHEKNT